MIYYPNMSADVLRRRLADTLEQVSSIKPERWIPVNPSLSREQILERTVNALNDHQDILGYDFSDSRNKLLEDLRDLTPDEIRFLSNIYHQAQAGNDRGLSLSCSDQIAVAAYEAKIIADHGLWGKAAVGFLRLID